MNVVNNGNARTHAATRGTTSSLNESTDRASIASICSVARISASDAPMPAPTRPATSKAATRGPISTKNERDCRVGIQAPAPNLVCKFLQYVRHFEGRTERIRDHPEGEERGSANPFETFRQHICFCVTKLFCV